MKLKQIIFNQLIPLYIAITVVGCAGDNENNHIENVDLEVIDELQRLAVETTADAEVQEITLPEEFNDANWGLKDIICEDGGYDLISYSGQTLTLTSVDIEGSCDNEIIKIMVLSEPGFVVCAYFAYRGNAPLAPGLWSVDSENCQY
jgi:hypothetical protein